MKIESYKAVVAAPQAHTEFLRHVVDLMEQVEGSGEPLGSSTRRCATSIDVGDNQFSQARHLHAAGGRLGLVGRGGNAARGSCVSC